ncbi:MAG TPA: metal-sensitive transcriptional regulator [Candidatus Methylomirabilis sp.]|nr:metal-sensitive transcriptional regulator [Candidatus Methylomirabilis sp.]HSC71747.1 metal-sensitive transcriptional regulator [Candidatus Methylomirabilis sp.]
MVQRKTVAPMPCQMKAGLLARLRTIEGHVRGILRMVEADAYCPEVLAQAMAVQRAIDRFSFELLEHHLEVCFVTSVRGDSHQDRERAIRELLEIFQTSAKLKRGGHSPVGTGSGDQAVHQAALVSERPRPVAQGFGGR